MSTHNHVVTLKKVNYIRKKVDCDRFRIEDFLEVCPYTVDELRKPNRRAEITAWRHVAATWLMLSGHNLSSAGAYIERQHCNVFHSLTNVKNSLDGFGDRYIRAAVLAICEQSRKPIEIRVPFDEYNALLRKHFGDTYGVKYLAEETYYRLPTIMLT